MKRPPRAAMVIGGVALAAVLGGAFHFWSPGYVTLSGDGLTRRVPATGKTVGELLNEHQISLGPLDFVTPPPETPLRRRMAIQVTRVTVRREKISESQPPRMQTQTRLKSNLRPVLVQKGTSREVIRTIEKTFHDQQAVSSRVLEEKIVSRPFYTLTLLDPKSQRPVKTYDLLKCPSRQMLATGYYVGDPLVPSDTVFLGYKLRRGFVAVDPKVIPLRTRLYVKGYGYAYAADTGSAIKGDRIDLAVADRQEEKRFSHRWMTVYILEKSPLW